MKKFLLLTVLSLSAAAFAGVPARADSAPVPAASASAPAPANTQAREQKFEAHKAKVLEKLGTRLSALQQKQSCVQAATSGAAMKACFPNRGEGKGKEGCRQ